MSVGVSLGVATFGAFFAYNYFDDNSLLLAFVTAIIATLPGLFFYFVTESHSLKYQSYKEMQKQTELLEQIKSELLKKDDSIPYNR
jgi:cell division protein FtsX